MKTMAKFPRFPLRFVVAACLLAALGSCQRRPSAPDLRDSKVYQSRPEGFRFLVPDGWVQTASAALPPGELEGQSFLVKYRINSPEPGARLQIECMADQANLDLGQHHASPSYGVKRWQPSAPPEDLQIHGADAQRLVYSADVEQRKMTKEVVCFRRRGRVYSFVGLCWSSDDKGRQQIRRAVESTIWDR
jgi:hypothetical protein